MNYCKIIFILFLYISKIALANSANSIIDYDTVIEIKNDAEIEVTEIIKLEIFEPQNFYNSVKTLPIMHKIKKNKNVPTNLKIISLSKNNKKIHFYTKGDKDNIDIFLSKKTAMLKTGIHDFELKYKIRNIFSCSQHNCSLLWQAINNNWSLPIDSASIAIEMPNKAIGYSLEVNEDSYFAISADLYNNPIIESTKSIDPGINLLFNISFSDEMFNKISKFKKIKFIISNHFDQYICFIGLILSIIFALILSLKYHKKFSKINFLYFLLSAQIPCVVICITMFLLPKYHYSLDITHLVVVTILSLISYTCILSCDTLETLKGYKFYIANIMMLSLIVSYFSFKVDLAVVLYLLSIILCNIFVTAALCNFYRKKNDNYHKTESYKY